MEGGEAAEAPWGRTPGVAVIVLLVIGAMASVVALRAHLDSRRAEARAEAAREGGDRVQEIVELGRVIRALSVDRRAASRASEALARMADAAERSGDVDLAREAWRELRSAWFAVRGLGDPGRTWIARAAAQLTRLGAPREAAIEPRLARPMASLVAVIAWLAWCGAGFGLIRFGMEPSGRLRPRSAAPWLIAIAVGLVIWGAALKAA